MRTGLVISMVLHAALIALALYPWPRPKLEISPEAPPILVETFEIAEETNIAAAAPEPAPPPPPEPPAPQPEATPPPPEPEPEPPPPPAPQPEEQQAALPPRPEPEPEPEPEPKKEPEPKVPPPPKLRSSSEPPSPKPPERKVPERKAPEPKLPPPKDLANEKPKEKSKEKAPLPKVAEKPKPEPAKKKDPDFDLDKILGKTKALAQNEDKRTPERSAAQSAQPRAAAGRGTKMTANEIDALRGMISKCWNIPAGAPRPEELVVKLKLYLNADGTVAREPELLDTARLASGDPYFRSAAEAAMRAVRVCAPYALPADKFEDWSEITINFRPPY